MIYGTLTEGVLTLAPKMITIGEYNVWNATEQQYRSLGYKPVQYAEPPEPPEGYDYEFAWTETETEIVQTYTLVEHELTNDEILAILLGEGGEE